MKLKENNYVFLRVVFLYDFERLFSKRDRWMMGGEGKRERVWALLFECL